MLSGLEHLAWAKEQGHVIAFVAEAEVIHVHNETPRGVFNRYRREAMAFRQIHPEAHFNLYDFVRLTTTNILSDLWHAVCERVLWKNLASIFGFRFMQFHGTRTGYSESGLLSCNCANRFITLAKENRKRAWREVWNQ